MSYAAKAHAGASLLDTVEPGWYWRVLVNLLDMESTRWCIIGQVFGSWDEGMDAVGIAVYEDVDWRQCQSDYGFDLSEDDYGNLPFPLRDLAWIDLNLAWIEEINKRVEADF